MSTLEKAIEIAAKAHAGQVDKGGQPYILHPLRIMLKMDTDEERIVAVLHDVIEDSDIRIDDFQSHGFSKECLIVLELLTRPKGMDYKEYLDRGKNNNLFRKIKIEDARDNSDIKRIPNPTQKDMNRCGKYRNVVAYLERWNEDLSHWVIS